MSRDIKFYTENVWSSLGSDGREERARAGRLPPVLDWEVSHPYLKASATALPDALGEDRRSPGQWEW